MPLWVLGSRPLAVCGRAKPSWSSRVLESLLWLFGILWQAPAKKLRAAGQQRRALRGLSCVRPPRTGAPGGSALTYSGKPSPANPRQHHASHRHGTGQPCLSTSTKTLSAQRRPKAQAEHQVHAEGTPRRSRRPAHFPTQCAAVRDDTPRLRARWKDRHEAHQFRSHTRDAAERAAKSRFVCVQGLRLPRCGQQPRIYNRPAGRSYGDPGNSSAAVVTPHEDTKSAARATL